MFRKICSLIFVLAAWPACADAEVMMATARQNSEKSLILTPFYQETFEQKFLLEVLGSGAAKWTGGTYSSQSEYKLKGKQRRGTFFVKLTGQPWENLQYYGAVGVGSSSIEIPSATVTNTFRGDEPGMTYLVGLRSNIFPETEVTPAVTVDLGFGWSRFYFDRMSQGTGIANIRLDTYEYHLGFSISRKFGDYQPYGGVNLVRRHARLKDISSGERAGGIEDYVSPFIGVKLPIFSRESFVAEMTFVDGVRLGVGLEMKLK